MGARRRGGCLRAQSRENDYESGGHALGSCPFFPSLAFLLPSTSLRLTPLANLLLPPLHALLSSFNMPADSRIKVANPIVEASRPLYRAARPSCCVLLGGSGP